MLKYQSALQRNATCTTLFTTGNSIIPTKPASLAFVLGSSVSMKAARITQHRRVDWAAWQTRRVKATCGLLTTQLQRIHSVHLQKQRELTNTLLYWSWMWEYSIENKSPSTQWFFFFFVIAAVLVVFFPLCIPAGEWVHGHLLGSGGGADKSSHNIQCETLLRPLNLPCQTENKAMISG